jgi:uncharacterized protein YbjT (DUF2867 family)
LTTRQETVLLTGATGYIGGRLIDPLRRRGVRVRCLARRPAELRSRVPDEVEVVGGDVLDPGTLPPAMAGADAAYYLIHSMGSTGDFRAQDREAALNFGRAAREAGVRRVVYLGGLGGDDEVSEHLASRHEVGRILRTETPAVELRASIIIGSGSLSFEMIRALVERLPVMVTPRWVRTPAQPIAIEDVIDYLVSALDLPDDGSVIYEIGGADRVSYGGIMKEYARQRGLHRVMVPVPFLTPWLSSLWLGLVTPLYARVGKKMVDGLRTPTVVRDDRALRDFEIAPRGIAEAIARALAHEDDEFARTRWSDALSSARGAEAGDTGWGGRAVGLRRVDSRSVTVPCPPAEAFAPVRRIGGDVGWYYGNPLWRLRGFLDLLLGGVGLRRGRRDPETPLPGDALDFWRVEAYEPDRLLRLRAEMKVPGRAWLQFEVEPVGDGTPSEPETVDAATPASTIRQTAVFDPSGLFGLLYWYALYPLHGLIFGGMLRAIAAAAGSGRADRPGPG